MIGLIVAAILQIAFAATMLAGWGWLLVNSDNPGLTAWLSVPFIFAAAWVWERNGWL